MYERVYIAYANKAYSNTIIMLATDYKKDDVVLVQIYILVHLLGCVLVECYMRCYASFR
jgi:hypothetical protein